MKKMDQALALLKQYYGYDAFRAGQAELILAAAEGRDTFGILPTGGGKSLCYQIPALLAGGVTVVVSPLISLIDDQVAALKKRGIRAAAVTKDMPAARKRAVLREALAAAPGDALREAPAAASKEVLLEAPAAASRDALRVAPAFLLYVSPERLRTKAFLSFAEKADIRLVAVDEAHCISEWGPDFRPAYLHIPEFLARLPRRPVLCACTATASPRVRGDICARLKLKDPFIYMSTFDRPNLYYEVRRSSDRTGEICRLLRTYGDMCGIIYCLTRSHVNALTRELIRRGFKAARYHAGMSGAERASQMAAWLDGTRPVMVATNAFGMGIDKPDVRFVIHAGLPATVEHYYQEAGRAGRDGRPSDCILLARDSDALISRSLILSIRPGPYRKRRIEQLAAMRTFAGGRSCLRHFLLAYFGEETPKGKGCGRCSVCLGLSRPRPALMRGVRDETLRRALLMIRLKKAEERHTLPHKILSDEAIDDLAAFRPVTLPDMLLMERVPFFKGIRYGADFLAEIRAAR